jgi:hypothetical protein
MMNSLAQAREELRAGDYAAAENTLLSILEGPDESSSHILFDLVGTYEELYTVTGRYEGLIGIARRCAERAQTLPNIDIQVHHANSLIVIANAELALGRSDDARRHALTAQEILGPFSPELFAPSSREKLFHIRRALKTLQKILVEGPRLSTNSIGATNSGMANGTMEWKTIVSQRNLSTKGLKGILGKMRQTHGLAGSAAILVDCVKDIPRAGNIGVKPELFSLLIEHWVASALLLSLDTQQTLFEVLHVWQNDQAQWLQRMIHASPKLGLAQRLQGLRRTLETAQGRVLDCIEKDITALMAVSAAEIIDGAGSQECRVLRQLDMRLKEFDHSLPSPFGPRLNALRQLLNAVVAKVDLEIERRNDDFARLLEAVKQAENRSAFTAAKAVIKKLLPAATQSHPEVERACSEAEDRLLLAEVEAFEMQDRAAHLAKLSSVRGAALASLLLKEYNIDLPTARQLVIDLNTRKIDREVLLDKILEIRNMAPRNKS